MPTKVMNKGGGIDGFCVGKKVMLKDVREGEVEEIGKVGLLKESDESSSSIGKNSDASLEKSGDGEEVQSSYKGPLDAMGALEEVLPIRKGISRFYKGKAKSFASLGDAFSIKDISKPENAYMRKRRNLRSCIAKRVATRTTLSMRHFQLHMLTCK